MLINIRLSFKTNLLTPVYFSGLGIYLPYFGNFMGIISQGRGIGKGMLNKYEKVRLV